MVPTLEIVGFRPELRGEFERLNRLWLEEHSLLEQVDLDYLQNPEHYILAHGGEVFFALDGETVAGVSASIRMSPSTYELAKLSVSPDYRGHGLGRRLSEVAIDYARRAGASEVVLTSHTALVEAIRLYESLGFQHAAMPEDVRYESANVFMRLMLSENVLPESGEPRLRVAQTSDIPRLEALITRSGIALSAGFYSEEQAAAVTQHVFGVDSQLIADQTYFAIEQSGEIVACGGWSKRRTLFGGDRTKTGPDPLLDPATEPARIRAFFVEPRMARRGLGRRLMEHCTREAQAEGFLALELASTMPGEPLYLASGFEIVERFDLTLPGDVRVPLSRMRKSLAAAGDQSS
jgi:GNAT superfamily N-acetyltransferase